MPNNNNNKTSNNKNIVFIYIIKRLNQQKAFSDVGYGYPLKM